MEETSLADTQLEPQDVALDELGVLDAADLLLACLAMRRAAAVLIEPREGRHEVHVEVGSDSISLGALDAARADAVVARLAIIAGLPIGGTQAHVGHLRVTTQTEASDQHPVVRILVSIGATPQGLVAEMRRIVDASDQPTVTVQLANATGQTIGNYLIEDKIGEGGMGEVYRAMHVVLEKPVALKVLRAELATNPVLAAQLVVEARAACRARHPGIVDVTDFGDLPDGRSFIVMELVEGQTLESLLRREGALPPQRVSAIARQIADALQAAASQGVVHRDLKPSNVFVTDGERIKLGDFGVARLLDAVGSSNPLGDALVGTIYYVAPEQGLKEPVDARSDIYSLGCVMFEMLTGDVPFRGDSLLSILHHHARTTVPPMVGPEGPVPEVLQRIVRRAMAKSPSERYQAAREMVADLERAAATLTWSDWRQWLP